MHGMCPGKLPEPGKAEELSRVTQVDDAAPITLPGKADDGIGADRHAPVDHPGEMNAEEWEFGVGGRIDEVPDQIVATGRQRVVLPAERDDLEVDVDPCKTGQAVRLQSAADDE